MGSDLCIRGFTGLMARILFLDCETAPKLAYVWKFWKENVSPKQVVDHGYVMSFSAKWLGSDTLYYGESRKVDDTDIVKCLLDFLDQADVVVAHNAKRFDLPTINTRAIVAGLKPPSPYKVVDTLLVAKKEFRFESNSLEYLAKVMGCTPKMTNRKFPGFELWLECIRNNEEAWKELKVYNCQDVLTLEEVYLKMRPWVSNHPNILVNDYFETLDSDACPKCTSANVRRRGYYYTNVSKYQRFQCQDCGGWHRSRYPLFKKSEASGLSVNAI